MIYNVNYVSSSPTINLNGTHSRQQCDATSDMLL